MTPGPSSDETLAAIDAALDGYVEWDGSEDAASWATDGSHEHDTSGHYYQADAGDDLDLDQVLVAAWRQAVTAHARARVQEWDRVLDSFHDPIDADAVSWWQQRLRDLGYTGVVAGMIDQRPLPRGGRLDYVIVDEARTFTDTERAELVRVGGRRTGRTTTLDALIAEHGLIDAWPEPDHPAPYGGPEREHRPSAGVRAQQSPYGPAEAGAGTVSGPDEQRRTDRGTQALRREQTHFKDMAALAATQAERDLWLSMATQVADYLAGGAQHGDVPLLGLVEAPP